VSKKYVVMRRSALSASIAAALGSAPFMLGAQELQPEEVVVTGTRIVRQDLVANSPIQTVDSEFFENSSTVGIETMLNQLPQFVPAITQFTTGDVQPSATNTTGANTVSLRGLGANRNLVLFDGRRAQPVNSLLVVDTNSIPSAAIERVEVVTGGASATYGADAIAGVVNFVMKKNFEGLSLDVQTGGTEAGDGEETRLSVLFGANLEGGRGNVMMGIEHADRELAYRNGREFFDEQLTDPSSPATNTTFLGLTQYSPNTSSPGTPTPNASNLPDRAAILNIFQGGPLGAALPANATQQSFYVNKTNQTLWTNGANGATAQSLAWGAYRYADGFPAMRGWDDDQPLRKVIQSGGQANGTVLENQPFALLSTPLKRDSIFARGRYEVADGLEMYAQANFVKTVTRTIMTWSPATGAWNAQIPHGDGIFAPSLCTTTNSNIGCPGVGFTQVDHLPGGRKGVACAPMGGCTNSQAFPVPPELLALLDSRRIDPDFTGPLPLGAVGSGRNETWTLNRVMDYLDEPRSTFNDSKLYQLMAGITGNVDAIDGSWDVYYSTGNTETQNDARGFGDLAQYRAIVAGSANYGRGAVVLGPGTTTPFQGTTGTASCTSGIPIFGDFALSKDCIDSLTASATNVLNIDQDIVEGTVQGRIGELWAGEVRFAAGASYRKNEIAYDQAGLNSRNNGVTAMIGLASGSDTSGETTAKDYFGEVLLPLVSGDGVVQSFALELGSRYSDYGLQGTSNTYKALFTLGFEAPVRLRGGLQHANRAPNVGELYAPENTAIVGSAYNGDPCASNTFAPWGANPAFNPNSANAIALCSQLMGPGAGIFYGDPQTGIFPTVTVTEQGNPSVNSEQADTVTFGAVLTLENIEVAVDWYKIEIEDVIGVTGYDSVFENCLSPQYNPSGTASGNPYCQYIQRNQETGAVLRVSAPRANLGHYETSGVDVQFNWRKQLGEGTLGLNVLTSFLDTYELQDAPQSAIIDIVGTNGAPGGAQYDYRVFTSLNHVRGPLSTTLRWRHYPSIEHSTFRADPNTPTEGSAKYDIFDVSGRWAFSEKYSIRFGIDNLLDEDPPIYGRNVTTFPFNSGVGQTINSVYDVLGRRAYVGFTAQF
jgi:iron complex outermembrane recepter protein